MTISLEELLTRAAKAAADHRASVADRPVVSGASLESVRNAFAGPLPDGPTPPGQVLDELLAAASGGVTGTVGPRFFGFVIGGSLPAATAADIVTTGWDQPAFNEVLSPAVRRRGAGGRRVAQGTARAAEWCVRRFRDRRTGCEQRRPGRGPASGARSRRMGRRARRADGCSQDPGRRRRANATPRSTGPCACSVSVRRASYPLPPTGTGRSTPTTSGPSSRPTPAPRRSCACRRAT